MEFTPHETYEGLLKQAYAMRTMIDALRRQVGHNSSRIDSLTRDIMLCSREEIDSEREANARLTNQIEVLERRIKELESQ